jgi:aminopeptidase YwaD
MNIKGFAVVVVVLFGVVSAFSSERMAADIAVMQAQPRVAGSQAAFAAGDYLAAELKKAGYTVDFQNFTYTRTRDLGSSLSVGGVTLGANAVAGSPNQAVTAVLVAVPGVGRAEDYTGLDVRGKIAVVVRGTIPFLEKARQAAEKGAAGIVIVNNAPGNVSATFGQLGPIPAVTVSAEDGAKLLSGSQATLEARRISEEVKGRNVIAKRTEQPVVILGAHYDSVLGGPGANDNASGSVAVLELARQLSANSLSERTWFVFFDGEEDGLWGSRRFVEQNPELTKGLKAMLNLDMVGVKVTDKLGLGGDKSLFELTQTLEANVFDLGEQGRNNSDHAPFAAAGVPVLFFHWGIDVNCHQPSDTVVDIQLIAQTAGLVQKVVEKLLAN